MTHGSKVRESGFDFARRLRDPEFRDFLKRSGYKPGQPVVMAHDSETVSSVIARIVQAEHDSPCLIAIAHDDEPFGFRLLFAEVAVEPVEPQAVRVSPKTSIGMVYSSLTRCGAYMPGDWTQPVLFERLCASA